MRGTQRRQCDPQLILFDMDVADGGDEFVQERSAFLLGPRIVWTREVGEIALGLVGEYLDDVSQVLMLGGELHEGLAQPFASGTQLLAELAVRNFKAAHAKFDLDETYPPLARALQGAEVAAPQSEVRALKARLGAAVHTGSRPPLPSRSRRSKRAANSFSRNWKR